MRSGGRQSKNHVAFARCRSIDDGVLFHDADAETRKIVVLAVIHARHLGRFASHQRAAGLHASFDDAGDEPFPDSDIEFAGCEVIEKEQRLGALHDYIVDAHRHQIDAHRIVAAGVDREAELGSDSIGSRHQHGFSIPIERYFDQGTESSNSAQHLAAHGTPNVRLDSFHEFLAGVDIDSGLAIGYGRAFGHSDPLWWMVTPSGRPAAEAAGRPAVVFYIRRLEAFAITPC